MAEQLQAVFGFLALIQGDAELRARLNEVCTADEVGDRQRDGAPL